ncbi:MAG: hypothetical protein WD851_12455 [Pirellulales bacterium]
MTDRTQASLDGNPFASHRTRPGVLEFCFPAGVSAESLVNQLSRHHWRGQIVGPHGVGKSTLIAALLPELHRREICTRAVALHDGQRRLPVGFLKSHNLGGKLVFIVDGYEQLSYLERLKLSWHCWLCGRGLLITTHSPAVRLMTLLTPVPSAALMTHLMHKLQGGSEPLVNDHAASVSFFRHGGNLREVWFDLYDQYERNRRQPVKVRQRP